MSTYGTLNVIDDTPKKRIYKNDDGMEVVTSFEYTEVLSNHYKYRHVVDDNNNNRMQPIALEKTWNTKDWNHRPYAFTLGVTNVNAQRGYQILGNHVKESNLTFQRNVAQELIFNKYMPTTVKNRLHCKRGAKKRKLAGCSLVNLPPYTTFTGVEIVKVPTKYNQWKCVCGEKRALTYCRCSPGFIYCKNCFVDHVQQVENKKLR